MDHDTSIQLLNESFSRRLAGVDQRITEAKNLAISADRRLREQGRKPALSRRDVLFKALTARLIAFGEKTADSVKTAERLYPNLPRVAKTVTNPAMTGVEGWAEELVSEGSVGAGLLQTLAPASVYAALSRRGLRVDMSGLSQANLLNRATPTGSPTCFVGEGNPIPVRAMDFSGVLLTPKKAAVISHYTREIARRSAPAIETILRTYLPEDITVAVDATLLGSAAATATQPAGLLAGVSPIAASTQTGVSGVVEDLGALAAAIANAADPVFIMAPATAIALAALPGAVPVILSDSVPFRRVIAIDASDFASGSADGASFEIVDDATLVAADPAVPIVDGAGALGNPTSSLWQLDLIGIRVIEELAWALRRTGRISYIDAVNWLGTTP